MLFRQDPEMPLHSADLGEDGVHQLNSVHVVQPRCQNAKMLVEDSHLDVDWVCALDSLNKGDTHLRSEVGVLSICLAAPAPPGVSEDVDVGPKAVETPELAPQPCSHSCA